MVQRELGKGLLPRQQYSGEAAAAVFLPVLQAGGGQELSSIVCPPGPTRYHVWQNHQHKVSGELAGVDRSGVREARGTAAINGSEAGG